MSYVPTTYKTFFCKKIINKLLLTNEQIGERDKKYTHTPYTHNSGLSTDNLNEWKRLRAIFKSFIFALLLVAKKLSARQTPFRARLPRFIILYFNQLYPISKLNQTRKGCYNCAEMEVQ